MDYKIEKLPPTTLVIELCNQIWEKLDFVSPRIIEKLFVTYDLSNWLLDIISSEHNSHRVLDIIKLVKIQFTFLKTKDDEIYWAIINNISKKYGKNYDAYIADAINLATLSTYSFNHMINKFDYLLGIPFFSRHLYDKRMPLVVIDAIIEKALSSDYKSEDGIIDDDKLYSLEYLLRSDRLDLGLDRCIKIIDYCNEISKEELSLDSIIHSTNFSYDLIMHFITEKNIKTIQRSRFIESLKNHSLDFTEKQKIELYIHLPIMRNHLNINPLDISIHSLEENYA